MSEFYTKHDLRNKLNPLCNLLALLDDVKIWIPDHEIEKEYLFKEADKMKEFISELRK